MYLSVKKEETVSKKYGCENKQHFILKKKLYPLVIALALWWSLSQNPLFVKGSFLLYGFCCVCVICVFQVVAFPIFFSLSESCQTSGQGSPTVKTKLFAVTRCDVRIESVASCSPPPPLPLHTHTHTPPLALLGTREHPGDRRAVLSLLSFIL